MNQESNKPILAYPDYFRQHAEWSLKDPIFAVREFVHNSRVAEGQLNASRVWLDLKVCASALLMKAGLSLHNSHRTIRVTHADDWALLSFIPSCIRIGTHMIG